MSGGGKGSGRACPCWMRDTSTYFLYAVRVMAFTTMLGAVKTASSRSSASPYCLRPAGDGGWVIAAQRSLAHNSACMCTLPRAGLPKA